MTIRFPCSFLKGEVELTKEREEHIAERHPDLLPHHAECLAKTLEDPDQIRRSERFGNALLFSRWFEGVLQGKFVVVVVMTNDRQWIITAYLSRKLAEGDIVWERS